MQFPTERPLLQLAADLSDAEEAIRAVEQVYPYFDIVEAGTPLVLEEGLKIVEAFKRRWPDKLCLADTKIMDAGALEAAAAFRHGADIATVLGVAEDATILAALKAAKEHGGVLMVDLINAPEPAGRATHLCRLGVELFCVHRAHDAQGTATDPLAMLAAVRSAVPCRLAVAGGLNVSSASEAVFRGADILVIGGGILRESDPRKAAETILKSIHEARK